MASKARGLANLGNAFDDGALSNRNKIINGAMTIDQRNAGASVSTSSGSSIYTVDRWLAGYTQTSKFTVQQNAGSVTPPVGFTNYLGITSASAYSVLTGDVFWIDQRIEGYNIADLGWGTADAKPVTLSFWARSSLTGTFGGSLFNATPNRSYPFIYTISSANTWEYKTITIAGDTSGTWLTNSGKGINVNFGLGAGSTWSGTAGSWASAAYYSATGATSVVGTNGATFYITGVQLEAGDTATPFEHRSYGQELALCQRYFQIANICCTDYGPAGYSTEQRTPFITEMRASPTAAQGSTGSTSHFNSSSNTLTVADLRHAYASATSASTGSYSSRFLNWQFSAEL